MSFWFLELTLAMIAVMLMSFLVWSTLLAPIARSHRGEAAADAHRGFERRAMERQDRRKMDRGPQEGHAERRRGGRRSGD